MSDNINNGHKESHDHRILNDAEIITDEKWQAIINNDATYNNQFFYAVKSTGVFCKPSCKSRVPKKENVCIFPNAEQLSAQIFALVNVASPLMKKCLIASGLI